MDPHTIRDVELNFSSNADTETPHDEVQNVSFKKESSAVAPENDEAKGENVSEGKPDASPPDGDAQEKETPAADKGSGSGSNASSHKGSISASSAPSGKDVTNEPARTASGSDATPHSEHHHVSIAAPQNESPSSQAGSTPPKSAPVKPASAPGKPASAPGKPGSVPAAGGRFQVSQEVYQACCPSKQKVIRKYTDRNALPPCKHDMSGTNFATLATSSYYCDYLTYSCTGPTQQRHLNQYIDSMKVNKLVGPPSQSLVSCKPFDCKQQPVFDFIALNKHKMAALTPKPVRKTVCPCTCRSKSATCCTTTVVPPPIIKPGKIVKKASRQEVKQPYQVMVSPYRSGRNPDSIDGSCKSEPEPETQTKDQEQEKGEATDGASEKLPPPILKSSHEKLTLTRKQTAQFHAESKPKQSEPEIPPITMKRASNKGDEKPLYRNMNKPWTKPGFSYIKKFTTLS